MQYIIILLSCLSLNAASYYVDYVSGDDSNNGTSTSRPWSYTGTIVVGYPIPTGMHQTIRIYNNTFLRGSGPTITLAGNTTEGARDVFVSNNILINDPGLPANAVMLTTGTSNDFPNKLDNNLYWAPDWSVTQKYLAVMGPYSYLSNLKANGNELNGLYTNPGLVDYQNATPALRDFHLTESSPAVGAGENLSEYFTTDYYGNARPSTGPWDIGAHQFNVPTPPEVIIKKIRMHTKGRVITKGKVK